MNAELTPEILLASACMPTLFQAIEINGEAYWDGGYAGKPYPHAAGRDCTSSDILLVQVNRSTAPARRARHATS